MRDNSRNAKKITVSCAKARSGKGIYEGMLELFNIEETVLAILAQQKN